MNLKGSKTEKNLKDAFAGESQANRRYLYFAQKADVEGFNDVSAVFRSTAEGETGHAHGHLEYLEAVGDPATGLPIGETKLNLKAAIAGETHEYTDMYPGMAKAAREEGFGEIADWFETLAKAERSHANRFQKALDTCKHCDADGSHGVSSATGGSGREGSLEAPTRHPLDWRDPAFYDRRALDKELERVFDICHGCRRCFSLCNAFPTLFDAVDATADRRGRRRCDKKVYWQVVDHCYLCDMCFMTKCPYVPPHPWNVDFPHLMLRAKAVRARRDGLGLREQALAATDRSGRIAGIPVVAEVGQRRQSHPRRRACCSRRRSASTAARPLPKYHARSARKRLARLGSTERPRSPPPAVSRSRPPRPPGAWRCSPPATATATSRSWTRTWSRCSSHNGIAVTLLPSERCCGMPRARARRPRGGGAAQGTQHSAAGAGGGGRLRHRGADPLLRADVQAGAAADVSRRCGRARGCRADVRSRSST